MTARQIIRRIVEAFRSEFGKRDQRDPWPRCEACHRRTAPHSQCANPTHLTNTCISCCLFAGSHPEGDQR